jgi:hypothetical protein
VVMSIKMTVFWDVAICSLVDTDHSSEKFTASVIRGMQEQ